MQIALVSAVAMHSTRAFTIKGIYSNKKKMSFEYKALIKLLANRLVQMYKHRIKTKLAWFESYMGIVFCQKLYSVPIGYWEMVYKESKDII
jgi:hypothetical protein